MKRETIPPKLAVYGQAGRVGGRSAVKGHRNAPLQVCKMVVLS